MKKLFLTLTCLTVATLAALATNQLTIAPGAAQVDGIQINTTADEPLAFHGATPVIQRASAAQVAVSTNALTVSGNYTQSEVQDLATRASALTTLANEIRAALVQKGLIKGTN